MTEADNGDNVANPTITMHYLLLQGILYQSANGISWQEMPPSAFAFPYPPTLSRMMRMLPPSAYAEAHWDYESSTLRIGNFDAFPTEPTDDFVGVSRHRFDIDLGSRSLRSYYLSTVPMKVEENGELTIIAPSTTFYSVIDICYQTVAVPNP